MADESNPAHTNQGATNVAPAINRNYSWWQAIDAARAAIDRNAEQAIDQFYDNYPQLYEWQRQAIRDLHTHGRTELSISRIFGEALQQAPTIRQEQTNPKTMETFMGKRIADYTIANVVRKPPVWLTRRLSEDELTDCKNNIEYLAGLLEFDATLANETFVSIFNRDTFFALGKKEINSVVSKYMQDKLAKLHDPLTDEYKTFIANQEKHFQKTSIEELENNAGRLQDMVDQTMSVVELRQASLAEAMASLRNDQEAYEAALQAVEDYDPTDSIDRKRMEYFTELSETTNWYYVGTELYFKHSDRMSDIFLCHDEDTTKRRYSHKIEGKDIFIAKTPLVTSEIDVANGISRSIECGIPVVAFYRNTNQISNCYFITKRPGSGSLHMHFTPNGVCWGNMRHGVRQMESDPAPRHVDILKAFDETMSKYNAGSPYIAFSTYQRKLKNAYSYTLTYYSYKQIPKQFLPAELIETYDTGYAKVAAYMEFKSGSVHIDRDVEKHIVDHLVNHEELGNRDAKHFLYDATLNLSEPIIIPLGDIEHNDWAGYYATQLMSKGYDESKNGYSTEIPRKFHYLRPSQRNVQRILGYTLPKGTRMLRNNDNCFYTVVGIGSTRSAIYIQKDGETEINYHHISTEDVFELPADCPTDSLLSYLTYSSKSYKQGVNNEERTANQSA